MRIARTIEELGLDHSKTIGFVPTMGALHQGHLDLMRLARSESEISVVSIFVNPLQFGPSEDFNRYPRNLTGDSELAESAGVDVIFAPSPEYMTPESRTQVIVSGLTSMWEGERRPGHFAGVTTIVAKLFNIIRPTNSYFGWKDLQQCLVLGRMVRDLNIPVNLKFVETKREHDGLALSSRNAYLSVEHRSVASKIYQSLLELKEICARDPLKFDESRQAVAKDLEEAGFKVDYLEWVSLDTLQPLRSSKQDGAIITACYLGDTRLIDNIRIAAQ